MMSRWPDTGRFRVAWHATAWLWFAELWDGGRSRVNLWHTRAAMRELGGRR